MSTDPFSRLSPFIKEYIYAHRWDALRDIQIQACQAIFDSDNHLLLASGTATGKTEAAFLPILTRIEQKPSQSLEVLYIGPLKALINDQFYRLDHLLKEADIPLWHWHGDVSATHKKKLLANPKGVLQITPESLESILLNHQSDLMRLFSGLQFVIIDEVHVFMGTDRGSQVLCQLERLEKHMWHAPRRIGLSASLGDYAQAKRWLQAKTKRAVTVPSVTTTGQRIRLALEHFVDPKQPDSNYVPYIFSHSRLQQGKCLLFTNNRAETEEIIHSLQTTAKQKGLTDIYYVHHGSIAASLRTMAENAMRDPNSMAVTAATVTLELGIDIGQLERVIQLGAPFSVSSFVQRLGRSGRRGNPAEMDIVTCEDTLEAHWIADTFPWQLLQAIAIVQLYLEERWLEPVVTRTFPVSLLYHQTMSILAAAGQLSPAGLAQRVLSLSPFSQISEADYRQLLHHLIELEHIQKLEDTNKLIIGLHGERMINNFRFYAVFSDQMEYTVQDEDREIGSILMPPLVGEYFSLAGKAWQVIEIDEQRRCVYVKKADRGARVVWTGGAGVIHDRIIEKIRDILLSNKEYPYLQVGAQNRLQKARHAARELGVANRSVVDLGSDHYCVFPWLGSRGFRTLERIFRYGSAPIDSIVIRGSKSPYYFIVNTHLKPQLLTQSLRDYLAKPNAIWRLLDHNEAPKVYKFDQFIPNSLLRKSYYADQLAVSAVEGSLKDWIVANKKQG